MDHGRVSDGDEFSNADRIIAGEMNNRTVLHIGGFTDLDEIDVAAQNATGPDARARPDSNITNKSGPGSNVSGRIHGWVFGEESGKLLVQRHARNQVDR